jgi:histidinol dehydrogenase
VSGALRVAGLGSAAGQAALRRLLQRSAAVLAPAVVRDAARSVRAVRRHGDSALLHEVARLDGLEVTAVAALRLSPSRESSLLPAGFAAALERSIAAVERFHVPQIVPGYTLARQGVTLEERRTPLSRVGLYVPGGRAVYPSTVVMTVVPARIAGVREIVVVTPPLAYSGSAALRHTLARLEIAEVWTMGGAHAIAALAYGTASIARVDKIVGPGNAWVAAAKRLVAGDVAVDGVAGPSEVVIVASAGADPRWLAADLLAQAEHDPRAAAVLLTAERELAVATAAEIERQLLQLPTAATARAALRAFGVALVTPDLETALLLAERIAPEHLQLVGPEAERLRARVVTCGALFVGATTPEVFGDYVAGPSHVLPTCGTARFGSALGVEDFVRRSHVIEFTAAAAAAWAPGAAVLADVEGLPGHAAAARLRAGAEAQPNASAPEESFLDPLAFVRPEVRSRQAYSLQLEPCRHKLDQNEVPWDLPRRLKQRVATRWLARDWSRYPDFHADELRRALAARQDWPWQGILVGNGSNELLATAVAAFAGPGREVLGVTPSFALYATFAEQGGGKLRTIAASSDLALPLAALLSEIRRDPTRPVLLCSPNNPTGAAATVAEIEVLLGALRAPLFLDNAYGEFCRHDYRPLLLRHRHLLLFRTFSKAWSVAGIRLGYLLADPALVNELIKVKLPYNLGHAAIAVGEVALAEHRVAERRVRLLTARRAQWAETLAAAGLEVFPSQANFVLVRAAQGNEGARRVRDGLATRGIRVRDVSGYAGLAGCLRVSVGDGMALRAVRQALQEIGQ